MHDQSRICIEFELNAKSDITACNFTNNMCSAPISPKMSAKPELSLPSLPHINLLQMHLLAHVIPPLYANRMTDISIRLRAHEAATSPGWHIVPAVALIVVWICVLTGAIGWIDSSTQTRVSTGHGNPQYRIAMKLSFKGYNCYLQLTFKLNKPMTWILRNVEGVGGAFRPMCVLRWDLSEVKLFWRTDAPMIRTLILEINCDAQFRDNWFVCDCLCVI